ncbi:ligand-binding sensor protein [Arthrobacter pascens]|nr:hypothetical protein [Arthrobacter pascens]MDR6555748.1 ligand-binding sensor protein [Arthrobacter pascens]
MGFPGWYVPRRWRADPEVSDSLTAVEHLRIRKVIASSNSVALTSAAPG